MILFYLIFERRQAIMSVVIGMKGRAETQVVPENTAAAVGSGLVPVFATPYMIALMENAAVNAVQSALDPGQGTVGTRLDVTHDAATPVGIKVWAEAEVTAVEGKKLTFSVQAFDEAGPIGGGTHERFIIAVDRFLVKAEAKKAGR
jgi:fluoroacetyl-CoA thioesterase